MTAAFMALSCALVLRFHSVRCRPAFPCDPAQLLAVDLIGGGKRELTYKNNDAWMLVGGSVFKGEPLDLVLSQGRAAPWHDESDWLRTLDVVRYRNYACLHNVDVSLEHALDFARINVLSAANKHVVDATDESVGTSSIAPEEVTGLVPTFIGKHLFGFFRHVEVSGHIGRRADPQLA